MLSQMSSTIRILSGKGNASIVLLNVVMFKISQKMRLKSTDLSGTGGRVISRAG